MATLQERETYRAEALELIYEATGSDTKAGSAGLNWLYAHMAAPTDEVALAVQWLVDRGWANWRSGGNVGITAAGVATHEEAERMTDTTPLSF